jgi:hypothetical protein
MQFLAYISGDRDKGCNKTKIVMPYVPFFNYLPDVAAVETRVITLLSPFNEFHLPAGEYAFVEFFCDECNCRRAFFNVMKTGTREPVATITWGWGTEAFYIKWYGSNDRQVIQQMMGSSLNLFSRQSAYAKNILNLFNRVLLKDTLYTSRVKRHYNLFRKKLKPHSPV